MKIICIALNYNSRAKEIGKPLPNVPLVFLKPDSALVKNNNPFFIPEFSDEIDCEAEIVLHISKVGKSISPNFAHRYYNKISVGINLTARDIWTKQAEAGLPWDIAKGFDASAQIGEFISVNDIEDLNNISFNLSKNGVIIQSGQSREMIFGFAEIISFVSKFFTLKTGDLIFTGTPAGVGKVEKNDSLYAYLECKKVLSLNVK